MADLKAFLNPSTAVVTDTVVISNRFTGEDGKPVPFEIKSITQAENDALIKASTKIDFNKRTHQREENLDKARYNARLIVECTSFPNFRDPELLQGLGVVDPFDAPKKLLLSGEFAKLADAIMDVNGFTEEEPEALREEAKN